MARALQALLAALVTIKDKFGDDRITLHVSSSNVYPEPFILQISRHGVVVAQPGIGLADL
jgi:hypothetical protein